MKIGEKIGIEVSLSTTDAALDAFRSHADKTQIMYGFYAGGRHSVTLSCGAEFKGLAEVAGRAQELLAASGLPESDVVGFSMYTLEAK
jgi:hypothetical protein